MEVETERFLNTAFTQYEHQFRFLVGKFFCITRLLQDSVPRSQDCYYSSNENVSLSVSQSIPFLI